MSSIQLHVQPAELIAFFVFMTRHRAAMNAMLLPSVRVRMGNAQAEGISFFVLLMVLFGSSLTEGRAELERKGKSQVG
ncbi:hypothetical protein [Priestia koreensis]|uniref:hypothetical protein n=1 Tax=Priestia koreensis TaxID=284581 RepID=UPI002041686C|nr:hypothetical protein [Priestia koreensis]MCM3006879.1 hypothetical protein [Priestia koreensis]